jgi:hypothetical protein
MLKKEVVIHVTSTLLPHPLAPSKATSEINLSLNIIGTYAQQLVSCIKFESRSHEAEKRIGYFNRKRQKQIYAHSSIAVTPVEGQMVIALALRII